MPEKIDIQLTKTEYQIVKFFREKPQLWRALKSIKMLMPGSIELHFDNKNQYKKKSIHIYESEKTDRA